jgi:hypothetical protein
MSLVFFSKFYSIRSISNNYLLSTISLSSGLTHFVPTGDKQTPLSKNTSVNKIFINRGYLFASVGTNRIFWGQETKTETCEMFEGEIIYNSFQGYKFFYSSNLSGTLFSLVTWKPTAKFELFY